MYKKIRSKKTDNKTDFLDPSKAAMVNPFYKPGGYIPNYIKPEASFRSKSEAERWSRH